MLVGTILVVGCLSADLTGDGLVSRADIDAAPAHLERYVRACVGQPTGPVCGPVPLAYIGGAPVLAPGGWLVSAEVTTPTIVQTSACHISGPCVWHQFAEFGETWTHYGPGLPVLHVDWWSQGTGYAVGCLYADP